MKLFSTVVLLEQVLAKSKLAATCDISHLFEGSETIYNVKCENDYGVRLFFTYNTYPLLNYKQNIFEKIALSYIISYKK